MARASSAASWMAIDAWMFNHDTLQPLYAQPRFVMNDCRCRCVVVSLGDVSMPRHRLQHEAAFGLPFQGLLCSTGKLTRAHWNLMPVISLKQERMAEETAQA